MTECSNCQRAAQAWIDIKDRVPTKEECVDSYGWFLVFRKSMGRAELDRYDGHDDESQWVCGWKYGWLMPITHWMPLPKPPEGV